MWRTYFSASTGPESWTLLAISDSDNVRNVLERNRIHKVIDKTSVRVILMHNPKKDTTLKIVEEERHFFRNNKYRKRPLMIQRSCLI